MSKLLDKGDEWVKIIKDYVVKLKFVFNEIFKAGSRAVTVQRYA